MDFNTPTLDSSGLWKLTAPYDTLLPLNTPLRCTGISNYELVNAKGVNVLKTYYEAKSLTPELYKTHLNDGGKIVYLKTKQGKEYSFPLHYLAEFPIGTGVAYCSHGIGVRLQALPRDLPLEVLTQQIQDLVTLTLGVQAQVETMVLSEVVMIKNEDHQRLTEARKALIKEKTPALQLIYDLKESNATLLKQREIAELQVIKLLEENAQLKKELAAKP